MGSLYSPKSGLNSISSVNEDLFQVLQHYGPVTALKIHANYVICGYGSILKIFKIENDCLHELVYSQQILNRNKIHNISVSSCGTRIVLSGGRSFIVLNINNLLETTNTSFKEKAINEWITSTEFLDQDTLLILTSHNIVYKINITDLETCPNFEIVDKIHCNEKSILYTGSIRIIGQKALIAAGTVMGGVIIWDLDSRQILHNLTDHEGSIFGVKIDSKGKHIISCSDDRSIKLYDFQSGQLLATGWGHGSRIWNLEFFKCQDLLKIFSTGEDCTARVWEYDSEDPLLRLLDVSECHLGKHVWSGDLDDNILQLSVTGGADGRIRLHDLMLLTKTGKVTYTLESIAKDVGIRFEKNEIIKQYFELPELNFLIVLTSHGKLLSLNQNNSNWELIELSSDEEDKFRNFGLIKGFININVVIICSRSGDLLVLRFDANSQEPISKTWFLDNNLNGNKVTNFMTSYDKEENDFYVLIDCPNPKVPFILHRFKFRDNVLKCNDIIHLEQPDQTSFTTTCMTFDSVNKLLILGSRYVSFAIYDLNTDKDLIKLSDLFKKLSKGDTITSISVVLSHTDCTRILITVRDGVYMLVELIKRNGSFTHEVIHRNKLSKGFVEGGFLYNDELIVFGFKSSYFYIWNETKQLEIASELCGGAHRQWELFRYKDFMSAMKFVYISKSTLHIKSFRQRFKDGSYGLINDGTHGREIRDIAVSPQEPSDDGSRLILTASEDTTIKLGKLFANGEIRNYWSLNEHISGLQRINFLNESYVGSSAANEEFFVWKLNKLDTEIPTITKYAALKPSQANPDLRIMDFDSYPFADGFIISTVYSDSNLKIWYFDCISGKFHLIANDFYTTCCILNVNFLTFNDRSKIYIMIGTTDGCLSFWDISKILKDIDFESLEVQKLGAMIIKQQLHQNGIKAVLCLPDIQNGYKIFTGGDDNALIYSNLHFEGRNEELVLKTSCFVEEAASSTITSISVGGQNHIVVTSVDQIVRLWEFDDSSITCSSARYTTIADTGCSDTTRFDNKNIIIVGGAGLSSWSF